MKILPIPVDASEEAFLDLYRQCDLNARETVVLVMRALTNPSSLNWFLVGSAIGEQAIRLERDGQS